jgi:glucokinase
VSAPASYAIGIDVGGTKIAAGLVDLASGRVLARRSMATRPERGGAAVLDDVLALRAALSGDAARLGVRLSGTGLGVCELVDLAGQVASGYTVAWAGLPVLERLAAEGPASWRA